MPTRMHRLPGDKRYTRGVVLEILQVLDVLEVLVSDGGEAAKMRGNDENHALDGSMLGETK